MLDAADEDGGAAWETTMRQARRVRLAGGPPPDAEVEIEEGTAPTPRERQRAARQKLGELAGFALEQSTKLTPTDEGFTVQTGEQSIECTVAEDDGDGRHTSQCGKGGETSGWRWWPPQRGVAGRAGRHRPRRRPRHPPRRPTRCWPDRRENGRSACV